METKRSGYFIAIPGFAAREFATIQDAAEYLGSLTFTTGVLVEGDIQTHPDGLVADLILWGDEPARVVGYVCEYEVEALQC